MNAPLLFISHGAPTFALEPGAAGAALQALGEQLPPLEAVMVVSPHWAGRGVRVGANPQPATIHDFGGFPAALYKLQYPAAGAPDLAERVVQVLNAAGITASIDTHQGLDHGVWVPLLHLLPKADVPVIPVRMPWPASPQQAFALGRALAPLRREGIMLIGSGSLTHNLGDFRGPHASETFPYVERFSRWMDEALDRGDMQALLNYRQQAPDALRAHPEDDHLLPFFVTLGAVQPADEREKLPDDVRYGMLSMASYHWTSRRADDANSRTGHGGAVAAGGQFPCHSPVD